MLASISDRRNGSGVKYSCDQYRNGGNRVLWLDGMRRDITLRVIGEIRAAGFKASRTGDQIWVDAADAQRIAALNLNYGL